MTGHEIRLEQGSLNRWRAVCSCGRYTSSSYAYKGYAFNAGENHIRSIRSRA